MQLTKIGSIFSTAISLNITIHQRHWSHRCTCRVLADQLFVFNQLSRPRNRVDIFAPGHIPGRSPWTFPLPFLRHPDISPHSFSRYMLIECCTVAMLAVCWCLNCRLHLPLTLNKTGRRLRKCQMVIPQQVDTNQTANQFSPNK